MRDQNARCVFQDEVQCLLDLPFGEWINARSRFIQDEDGRFLHQYPHQRHELTLSHRETSASFSDLGLNPVGKRFQPFAVSYFSSHLQHLSIAYIWRSITDVICYCTRKQKWDLGHDS